MKPNTKTRIGFFAQLEPQPNQAPAVLLCEAENGGIFVACFRKFDDSKPAVVAELTAKQRRILGSILLNGSNDKAPKEAER